MAIAQNSLNSSAAFSFRLDACLTLRVPTPSKSDFMLMLPNLRVSPWAGVSQLTTVGRGALTGTLPTRVSSADPGASAPAVARSAGPTPLRMHERQERTQNGECLRA